MFAFIGEARRKFRLVARTKQAPVAYECLAHLVHFATSLKLWFHKQHKTTELMAHLDQLNEYLVAEVTTLLLIVGLILSRIEPFHESLFFVGVITFLLVFLNLLIRDLDNPFGYYEAGSTEDVSLKPLDDLIEDLGRLSRR